MVESRPYTPKYLILIVVIIYMFLSIDLAYSENKSNIHFFEDQLYKVKILANSLEPFTNEIRFEVVVSDKNNNPVEDAVVKIRSVKTSRDETGWAYALNTPAARDIYSTILSLPPNGTWRLSVEVNSTMGKGIYPVKEITIPKETRSSLGGGIFFGVHILIICGGVVLWKESRRIRNK